MQASASVTDGLRVPPRAIEAEQAVLGGVLIDNRAWEPVAERLKSAHFYRADHQLIFDAMFHLAEKASPIDIITVSDWLTEQGALEKAGGMSYLGTLAKNTPSAVNIQAYVDIVYERALYRELIAVGQEITELGFLPSGQTATDIINQAEKKVFELADKGVRGKGPETIKAVVARALDQIEALASHEGGLTGLSTGFTDFDKMTSGLQKGDLVIVAGRPSMGKTVLGMNIAEHAAITSGKSVMVFSLEMPGESIAMRMLSSLGRIEQQRLRSGDLNDQDWTRVSSAVSWLNEAKLVMDDTPGLTPMEMLARARRVARESELGLIVVDYLQLVSGGGRSENRTAEISEISRSLKAMAKELNVPVIALSQLNRSLEQRPNKRPVMSDLRESGAIEQDADLIVFIYRDEVYNEDSEDKGTAEIIIGKHRNGPIGMFRLTFLGQYTRFENFMQEHAYAPTEGASYESID